MPFIPEITALLPFALSGALIGLLVGMTGVGGGSLMTPLLTLLFGVAPNIAVGTDLAFAALTKGFGTLAHRMHGHVRWDIVRRLSIGSLPAAVLTILLMKSSGGISQEWNHFIRVAIGCSVLLTALSLIFRASLLRWVEAHPRWQLHGQAQLYTTIGVGAIIGILVTISSIGAGAIGATLILLLYPTLKSAEVAGTDIAYAVPLTTIAALGHFTLGHIHFDLLIGLLLGSFPGIWIGARLSKNLPERWLKYVLATALTLVGVKLVT